MREKIRAKMARAIDLYDEWYDGICDAWQKRFGRFCHRVEELIGRAIKTATKAIRRCLGAYERHFIGKTAEDIISRQSNIADMWMDMIPPPDGEAFINRFGTVCMSYNTLKQLGYECDDKSEIFAKWKKEWEEK